MGNHRGQRRAAPRRRSEEATAPRRTKAARAEKYVGRRVAGRIADAPTNATLDRSAVAPATPLTPEAHIESLAPELSHTIEALEPHALARVEESAQVEPTVATRPLFATPTPTVELPTLAELAELTGEFPALSDPSTSLPAVSPGKRRAVRHAGPRGPLFKGLPTLPVAVGVATLAVAIGGAVTSSDPALVGTEQSIRSTNATTGAFGSGTYDALRASGISRDSERGTLEQASDAELVDEAEKLAEARDAALVEMQKGAEAEAQEIALNAWVLPIDPGVYRLTARYGEYGLWSSYHTGLDFAAPSGTPIRAVTNGVITSVGYDGAYGNKTVLTLEDGTEIWICHQSSMNVSPGEVVQAGELIGYVGSTGNVTGPHLHLEVRPGGGDPVDPDAALRQHGVTP